MRLALAVTLTFAWEAALVGQLMRELDARS